jgi:hypothetical protein
VLLILAVVLGIVLLNKFDTGRAPFSEPVESNSGRATTTTRRPSVSAQTSTSSRALRPADQVKVLPANGTGTSGLGGRTGTFLSNNGYDALAPVDATRDDIATSLVLYRADFDVEARALAQLLGLPTTAVKALDDNAPVPDTRGADIVVVAGADLHLPNDTTSTTKK